MDGGGHRLLRGSLPEDVGEAIGGKTLAVLSGDAALESGAEVRVFFVMGGRTLTIREGRKLVVTSQI